GAGDGAIDSRWLLAAIVVAVVGLIVIGLLEDIPVRHSVEHQLADRSRNALAAAGLTGYTVQFTGRDGTVWVATAADGARALRIVRSQTGVREARVIVGTPPGGPGPQAGGTPPVTPAPSTPPPSPVGTPTATPTTPAPNPTPSTGTGGPQTLP